MKSKEGSAKEEKDALTSELQAQTKEKTKLEFTLKDLRDEVAGDSNSKVGRSSSQSCIAMDELTIKTPNPRCRLFFKLTC